LSDPDCAELLAHCVSLSLNALAAPQGRAEAETHSAQIAGTLPLDMRQSWEATAERYFSRVAKAQILEAVTEAVDARAAERIAHLKKSDMAKAAETLLKGTGWLPDVLRTEAVSAQNEMLEGV
jgi:ParB family chromosome partitioning protein